MWSASARERNQCECAEKWLFPHGIFCEDAVNQFRQIDFAPHPRAVVTSILQLERSDHHVHQKLSWMDSGRALRTNIKFRVRTHSTGRFPEALSPTDRNFMFLELHEQCSCYWFRTQRAGICFDCDRTVVLQSLHKNFAPRACSISLTSGGTRHTLVMRRAGDN